MQWGRIIYFIVHSYILSFFLIRKFNSLLLYSYFPSFCPLPLYFSFPYFPSFSFKLSFCNKVPFLMSWVELVSHFFWPTKLSNYYHRNKSYCSYIQPKKKLLLIEISTAFQISPKKKTTLIFFEGKRKGAASHIAVVACGGIQLLLLMNYNPFNHPNLQILYSYHEIKAKPFCIFFDKFSFSILFLWAYLTCTTWHQKCTNTVQTQIIGPTGNMWNKITPPCGEFGRSGLGWIFDLTPPL